MTRCAALLAWAVLLTPAASVAQQPGRPPNWNARVSGRVVDADTGRPLADVRVSLGSTRLLTTEVPSLSEATTSNDDGSFELPVIPPGDYSLSVNKVGYYVRGPGGFPAAGGQRVSVRERQRVSVMLAMNRGGAITGRIVDELGEPVAAVQVNAQRYAYEGDGTRRASRAGVVDRTDDLGQFRVYGLPPGDFAVVARRVDAAPATPGSLSAAGQVESPPTYYPGTFIEAQAQTVSLGPGQEASVQFTLRSGRVARVSGRAMMSNGAPAAGMRAMLSSRVGSVPSRPLVNMAQDGTFAFSGVAPGDYWIDVRAAQRGGELGSIPITVGTEDITDLSIVTRQGATLRGRVVFEGQRPDDFRLVASLAEGMRGPLFGLVNLVTQADGRFEVTDVLGSVVFSAMDNDRIVKAVTVGGVDAMDAGIDPAGKDVVAGILITVTDKLTSVSGRVADDKGKPFAGYLVVLFRLDGVPPGAFASADLGIRAIRTDAAGRFEARKLRPGSWVAGTVEDLEPGYHFSPDFQERLRTNGRRFSVADGEEVVLDLEPTSGLP